MAGLLASGDVYYQRIIGAVGQGYEHLGNTTSFSVKESSDLKERPSKGKTTYGQTLSAVYIKKPSEMSLAFDEADESNLKMALLGESAAVNDGAGTLADVSVSAKTGKWVQIGSYRNIVAAGLTVKDDTDTVTHVLGTDYDVNYAIGMLKVLAGGSIADGDVLHVSGTNNAITGTKISGGTKPNLRGGFILDGVNLDNERNLVVTIPLAVITPDSPIDFKSSDWASVTFSGRPILQDGAEAPYTVEYLDLA